MRSAGQREASLEDLLSNATAYHNRICKSKDVAERNIRGENAQKRNGSGMEEIRQVIRGASGWLDIRMRPRFHTRQTRIHLSPFFRVWSPFGRIRPARLMG
jgi:hypothetical protein